MTPAVPRAHRRRRFHLSRVDQTFMSALIRAYGGTSVSDRNATTMPAMISPDEST